VLRRIFAPKREGVVGGWRRLHNEGLSNFYASPHTIRVINTRWRRWAWHIECMGEMINAYVIFIWKPERKRLLGRPRRR
jgi:hypothetical protein